MGKIEEWFLKIAARMVAKKINLQEGPMEDRKKWYKPAMGWTLPEVPPVVLTVLGALGIYGRAVADKKIK